MDEHAAKGEHIANDAAATKPSHDEVEKTAYALSREDGRPKVSAKENWLEAEAQLQHAGSGHAEHSEHQEHAGHGDHHAHMAADFRKRLWIALVLTLPIPLLSSLLQSLVGLREAFRVPGDVDVLLGLSSAVFWYGGWLFL